MSLPVCVVLAIIISENSLEIFFHYFQQKLDIFKKNLVLNWYYFSKNI